MEILSSTEIFLAYLRYKAFWAKRGINAVDFGIDFATYRADYLSYINKEQA
jgi:hypothetical protein